MAKAYFPNEDFNKISCGIVAFTKDAPWSIVYANEKYYSEFSNGNTDTLNVIDEDLGIFKKIKENFAEDKTAFVRYRSDAGKDTIRITVMSVSEYNDDAYLGVVWDATDRHEMIERIQHEKDKFAMALCSSKNMVFEDDLVSDVSVLYVSDDETGDIKKVVTKNIFEKLADGMVHPHDKKFFLENLYNEKEKTLSARLKIKDGDWKWYRIHRQFEFGNDGKIEHIFGFISDVDDERRKEEEIKKKLEIDPVLKIYNRNAGVTKINSYLHNHTDRKDYALLIMDIDNFKMINDTFGHLYGDAVIEMTAGALREAVSGCGFAGRYGGDEFFAFIHSVSEDEIHAVADDLLDRMSSIRLADDTGITGSVGIAVGTMFDKAPEYRELLEKADKALYFVKKNGKAHWREYDDVMSDNDGHSLDYEQDEDVSDIDLLESKDMMKVFLELSAGAKTSDEAVYNIIKYMVDKFRFDWMQIMQVNSKEDLITIRYEWCRDKDFHNNAGRSGYYVHSDIMNFRKYFEQQSVFKVCDENINEFSPKFQREFEKNMRYNVIYISDTTKDDNFYMFVCTRFDKQDVWRDDECTELNNATKIMAMYISQTSIKSENEEKLQKMIDYDRKTNLYSISEFYVQLGRLRKNARENGDDVILFNCDIGNFMKFNRQFGIEAGDNVLFDYGKHIKDNYDEERCTASHLDGTDTFYLAARVKKGDSSFIEKFNKENIYFCSHVNDKYKGADITIRTGVYFLGNNEDGGFGFDNASLAKKRYTGDRNKTFCVIYDKERDKP